jgi:EAL domain-containing protein (putative c-di-GMP-specific phosphodiesterase class I)
VLEKTRDTNAPQRSAERQTLKVSLDISLHYLQQPSFLAVVKQLLRRYDIPQGVLEFEFADTSAILRNDVCRKNIRALHAMGVRIVLDRFGTGNSSLVDLAELPVWSVKLDRRFIDAVSLADGNRSMGRAIIAMAHSMGVETTVFGVETDEHARRLRELGCDALQGRWVGPLTDAPVQRQRSALEHGKDPGAVDIPA